MGKTGADKGLLSTETMDKVGAHVAQQNAMAQSGKTLGAGSRLFTVEAGWQSGMISKDAHVRTCESLLELEEAFAAPDVKVVFIPLGAMMAEGDIEKVCARHGTTRTIFKEVEKS